MILILSIVKGCLEKHIRPYIDGRGSRSHAKNENKIQTSGHRGSVENIEKLGFKIMKLGMVSCHGSTMPW